MSALSIIVFYLMDVLWKNPWIHYHSYVDGNSTDGMEKTSGGSQGVVGSKIVEEKE